MQERTRAASGGRRDAGGFVQCGGQATPRRRLLGG